MIWFERQSDVHGYQDIIDGLNNPAIKNKETLNLYLKGLYKKNIMVNYMNHAVDVNGLGGKRRVQKGQRSLDDNEFKLFNVAIEEKYNSLPGTEPLQNPFSSQSFGAER